MASWQCWGSHARSSWYVDDSLQSQLRGTLLDKDVVLAMHYWQQQQQQQKNKTKLSTTLVNQTSASDKALYSQKSPIYSLSVSVVFLYKS